MEKLSLGEKIHSTRNRLFWNIRSIIRFQRDGYTESSSPEARESALSRLDRNAKAEWLKIEAKYAFQKTLPHLSIQNYQKNLFTLWALEQLLGGLNQQKRILEVGSQDFSRLPAFREFFVTPAITALEIDPFPILQEFHSRIDKANYFISLSKKSASYLEGDFFQLAELHDLIICFYPFVSVNPALAWGLPAQLGNPNLWLSSLDRNLAAGGLAVVVHQGDWEEIDFDEARLAQSNSLELIRRSVLNCPFFETEYPAHASVYRKR